MCGHFGIILSASEDRYTNEKLRKYIDNAVLAGDLRGGDGCGFVSITKKDVSTYKKGVDASEFRKDPEFLKMVRRLDLQAVLGHNRKGTFGTKSDDNAHPFVYGNIYLLHNGTLTGGITKYKDYAVDSEYIADNLNKHINNPTNVLEKIEGAYSLVWYNLDNDTISFARNSERPMFFANTKAGSLVYASEKKMLDWICERNSIDISDIVQTEPGELIVIPLKDFKSFKTSHTITKFTPLVRADNFESYYLRYGYSRYKTQPVKSTNLPKVIDIKKESTVCKSCGESEGRFYLRDNETICEMCDKILDWGQI